MDFIFSLFSSYPYFDLPYDIIGWLGLIGLLSIFLLGISKLKEKFQDIPNWKYAAFIFLAIVQIVVTLFIGFRFPGQQKLSLLGFRTIYHPAAVMVFSALPIVIAAGFLGPIFASLLGGVNGLMLGLWDTHSLFTIVEIAGLSFVFSWAIRQNYRTLLFRLLRHPLLSALLIPIFFSPVFMLSSFLSSSGELAIRIDYAITQSWPFVIACLLEFVFAGFIAELISFLKIKNWGWQGKLSLAPTEKSLSLRFVLAMVPLFVLAFMVLLVGDWFVAGRASRTLLEDRLASISLIAADSLPYFLETGQNLIINNADIDLVGVNPDIGRITLSEMHSVLPFFSNMVVFDKGGEILFGYPEIELGQLLDFDLEPVELALSGVNVQTYAYAPKNQSESAQLAFIARISGAQNLAEGVIMGLTDLNTNPFTKSAIQAIKTIEQIGGEGWILDENHRVVYHSDPSKVMDKYFGIIPKENKLIEQSNPGEAPRFLYYRTIEGRPWVIVLSVPSSQVQQLSFDIVVPLLIILLLISLVVFLLWRFLLRQITGSLQTLAKDATLIARGKFNHSLNVKDHNELGKFANAFEQMRLSLHVRAEKLDSILSVSQNITAHLNVKEAISPILKTCLKGGAVSARAVLYKPLAIGSLDKRAEVIGFGRRTETYNHLDQHLAMLLETDSFLSIPNCQAYDLLRAYPPIPGSIIAFTLKHEKNNYGLLWIAFENPREFVEDEVDFLSTLASQASLAAANSYLYTSSEVGRQRLEAVLASSPEPVLVFDQNENLLLLNPAANQIPTLIKSNSPGTSVSDVVAHKILLNFIQQPIQEGAATREITMSNGRIYSASVAEVIASGQHVGKICLLRDVTQYKEIDSLKSEFVSTVSHDLKFPLTLLRGYSTMLEMVGELNPQQKSYSQKVLNNVDQMTHLVDNILDLGRIESGLGLNITKTNVVNVIEKVVTTVEPRAMQKNIQLIINENVESTITIEADPALLQQALLNLVENAVKYTPIGGQIEFITQFGTESVIFEIKDNGIGISPLDLPHMFEKFYRSGHREVYGEKGTGLGLAIVKSIAERHGGRVWVQSQLGSGSIFFIEIPFRQEE